MNSQNDLGASYRALCRIVEKPENHQIRHTTESAITNKTRERLFIFLLFGIVKNFDDILALTMFFVPLSIVHIYVPRRRVVLPTEVYEHPK